MEEDSEQWCLFDIGDTWIRPLLATIQILPLLLWVCITEETNQANDNLQPAASTRVECGLHGNVTNQANDDPQLATSIRAENGLHGNVTNQANDDRQPAATNKVDMGEPRNVHGSKK